MGQLPKRGVKKAVGPSERSLTYSQRAPAWWWEELCARRLAARAVLDSHRSGATRLARNSNSKLRNCAESLHL